MLASMRAAPCLGRPGDASCRCRGRYVFYLRCVKAGLRLLLIAAGIVLVVVAVATVYRAQSG